jgi:acetyl esterase/lipase
MDCRCASLFFVPLIAGGCLATQPSPTTYEPHHGSHYLAPRKQPMKPTADFSDLPYKSGGIPAQRLDLYLPPGKKNEPLIVFIHGGAWVSGDKAEFAGLGRSLADHGFAAAIVNYRLSRDYPVKDPEYAKDIAAAYVWLVSQAAGYGYSPQSIFVGGHSAGAHTAGMLATGLFLTNVQAKDRPAGFFGLEGIYDIPDLNANFPTYKNWFLDQAFAGEPSWKAGSPTERNVVIRSPWLVIHSTQDELVDTGQSKMFVEHLKQQEVKADYLEAPWGSHETVAANLRDPGNPARRDLEKWALKLTKRQSP